MCHCKEQCKFSTNIGTFSGNDDILARPHNFTKGWKMNGSQCKILIKIHLWTCAHVCVVCERVTAHSSCPTQHSVLISPLKSPAAPVQHKCKHTRAFRIFFFFHASLIKIHITHAVCFLLTADENISCQDGKKKKHILFLYIAVLFARSFSISCRAVCKHWQPNNHRAASVKLLCKWFLTKANSILLFSAAKEYAKSTFVFY